MPMTSHSIDQKFSVRIGDYLIKADKYNYVVESYGYKMKKNPETGKTDIQGSEKELLHSEYPASLKQAFQMVLHKLILDSDVTDCKQVVTAIDESMKKICKIVEEI